MLTKKRLIVVMGIALIFLQSCGYNTMVSLDEAVSSSWAQVQNVYQRRADLIPNLVEVTKGYAKHEQETLTAVIEARAKATQVTIDPKNLTAENIKQFQNAQNNLSSTLSRLLVSVERYPELKANQNFLALQVQLEGTENRITVERNRFNEAVKAYNAYIRSFPQNFIASWFKFEKKAYFEGTAEAQTAPQVKF